MNDKRDKRTDDRHQAAPEYRGLELLFTYGFVVATLLCPPDQAAAAQRSGVVYGAFGCGR